AARGSSPPARRSDRPRPPRAPRARRRPAAGPRPGRPARPGSDLTLALALRALAVELVPAARLRRVRPLLVDLAGPLAAGALHARPAHEAGHEEDRHHHDDQQQRAAEDAFHAWTPGPGLSGLDYSLRTHEPGVGAARRPQSGPARGGRGDRRP